MQAPTPVLVGGDIGAYALMRAFHEAYGVRGVIVSRISTRAFAHTRLADQVIANVDDAEELVSALLTLAADRPGERLVLLTNADWYVETLAAARDRLEAHYEMPMCTLEQFARVSDKALFQADCQALGIPVPRTVAVSFKDGTPAPDTDLDSLTFPVIGKPASSAEFYYVDYPGKLKVHDLADRPQVDDLLARLAASGFTGTYLLQDFIPGDETQMRSLTAYRDSRGKVTMLVTGRVLLEEHTPGTLGVPAAILTEPYGDAMEAMTRYLDRVDYRGFANADYKRDARTGRHVFFEVNPRIGRNNWYTTASGVNPAKHVMADLDGADIVPARGDHTILYSVVPLSLLRRYLPERALRKRVLEVAKRGIARPLHNPEDRSVRRDAVIAALTWNYWRKYLKHYPRPTASGH
ncbi:carboxylate--amine ligase [Demequina zhanjiangensis]|uniref:Carboxylate--amine ligase n=1 Tax=Demequina zhanjiangensis TaxID=3051659 RepID=A0ABT8G142_9MICO|nr:carboxylate--amine ligase [Demequina sp. SYSU T00b26]MDN4472732.1 carboxylate--amine ligase [Demequina sp. SYSU T00b26]